jgi:hypothetical protein
MMAYIHPHTHIYICCTDTVSVCFEDKTAAAAQPISAQCHHQATGFTLALNDHENHKLLLSSLFDMWCSDVTRRWPRSSHCTLVVLHCTVFSAHCFVVSHFIFTVLCHLDQWIDLSIDRRVPYAFQMTSCVVC